MEPNAQPRTPESKRSDYWACRNNKVRHETAILLAVGGIVAVLVALYTWWSVQGEARAALNYKSRDLPLQWGFFLSFVGIFLLLSLLDAWRIVGKLVGGDTDGKKSGASIKARWDEATSLLNEYGTRRAVLYYFSVTVLLIGLWFISAALGGYVSSPIGLLFFATIQFGQIRAAKRQDILILFAAGVIGIAAMDWVVRSEVLADYFSRVALDDSAHEYDPGASPIAFGVVRWYPLILLSLALSTIINLTGFEAVTEEDDAQTSSRLSR